MSLYDIFGEDPVHEKGDDGRSPKKGFLSNKLKCPISIFLSYNIFISAVNLSTKIDSGLPSSLRLLQSQIHIKKTQLAQQVSFILLRSTCTIMKIDISLKTYL